MRRSAKFAIRLSIIIDWLNVAEAEHNRLQTVPMPLISDPSTTVCNSIVLHQIRYCVAPSQIQNSGSRDESAHVNSKYWWHWSELLYPHDQWLFLANVQFMQVSVWYYVQMVPVGTIAMMGFSWTGSKQSKAKGHD